MLGRWSSGILSLLSMVSAALLLGACAAPPPPDTRPLAQRLPAEFVGRFACAECAPGDFRLQLYEGGLFVLAPAANDDAQTAAEAIGRWLLSSNEQTLVLRGNEAGPQRFRVESAERLWPLTADGAATPWVRQPTMTEQPRTLPMRGMYSISAGEAHARFEECRTGAVSTVLDGPGADLARGVYRRERVESGAPLLVQLEGRWVEPSAGQPAGGEGGAARSDVKSGLEIVRFERAWPDLECPERLQNADLTGTFWRLEALAGQRLGLSGEQRPAYIRLERPGRLHGSTSCNRVVGTYHVEGTHVAFSDLATSRKGCPGGAVLELMFTQALQNAAAWNVAGRELELIDAQGHLLARFVASGELRH